MVVSRSLATTAIAVVFGPLSLYEYNRWSHNGLVLMIIVLIAMLLLLLNILRRVHLIEVADGVYGVLERMRFHAQNAKAQIMAREILLELLNRKLIDYTKSVVEYEGISILLQTTKKHMEHAEIIYLTIEIVWKIVKDSKYNNKMGEDENLEMIAKIMQSNTAIASGEVQRKCFMILGCLADGNSKRQSAIGHAGFITAISDSMKIHIKDAKVQQWGCWAFFNIAYENVEMKKLLGYQGAIKQSIEAMANHPNNLEIHRFGCLVIGNCLVGVPKDISSSLLGIAISDGAFPVITHAMDEFREAQEIQDMGLMILNMRKYSFTPKADELE